MSETSSQYHASAAEIAASTLARSSAEKYIPSEFLPIVKDLLTTAAQEGIEFGEAVSELPVDTSHDEKGYYRGHLYVVPDLDNVEE